MDQDENGDPANVHRRGQANWVSVLVIVSQLADWKCHQVNNNRTLKPIHSIIERLYGLGLDAAAEAPIEMSSQSSLA